MYYDTGIAGFDYNKREYKDIIEECQMPLNPRMDEYISRILTFIANPNVIDKRYELYQYGVDDVIESGKMPDVMKLDDFDEHMTKLMRSIVRTALRGGKVILHFSDDTGMKFVSGWALIADHDRKLEVYSPISPDELEADGFGDDGEIAVEAEIWPVPGLK